MLLKSNGKKKKKFPLFLLVFLPSFPFFLTLSKKHGSGRERREQSLKKAEYFSFPLERTRAELDDVLSTLKRNQEKGLSEKENTNVSSENALREEHRFSSPSPRDALSGTMVARAAQVAAASVRAPPWGCDFPAGARGITQHTGDMELKLESGTSALLE